VVPYSIDEAFIDFSGISGDLTATSRHLRATVLQELGLPTSVGIAPTKTLAKLANHIAKTCDRKPEHYPRELSRRLAQVCNTAELSAAELETLMAATEVGDVWGVGRKIAAQLNTAGVRTVLDLVRADIATLRQQFSVVFEKTVVELRGTPCMGVEEAPAAKQQILVSRSFGKAVTHIDGIVEAVSEFASRAAEKLRLQGSAAGAIQVFIRTSPFRENDRQHSPSLTVPVRPTADSRKLVAAACEAARSMFRPGFNYAKAGVMLMDLQDAAAVGDQGELALFSGQEPDATIEPDRPALMQAMDTLNRRFGRGAVRIGSTTTVKASDTGAASWAVRQDRRTPRYTTRWDEMQAVRS
jgi:DNA polymerase V